MPELLGEERALLSERAVPRRRLQFQLGRAAAHEALQGAGHPACPIGRGVRGEPLWPDNIVGAITHTDDVAIAAVAPRSYSAGIGIDLEAIAHLSKSIDHLVYTSDEQAWIAAADGEAQARCRRAQLFSAKEAIFKAVYPASGQWLDYLDASLRWCSIRQVFSAAIPNWHGPALEIGCQTLGPYVFTATWLPATLHEPATKRRPLELSL
ncbi:MAG: 4'-phosphopantetheinyl transferase family protein [Chloroflexota bacterium]